MISKIISLPDRLTVELTAAKDKHQALGEVKTKILGWIRQLNQSGLSKTLKEEAGPVLIELFWAERVQPCLDDREELLALLQGALKGVEGLLKASKAKIDRLNGNASTMAVYPNIRTE